MKLAADAPQVQINTALAHRSFSEAESLAKLALANRPNSLTIQLLLAQALGEQGKDSEVDSLLRSAKGSLPRSKDLSADLARTPASPGNGLPVPCKVWPFH
jgi:predicted Zn-dependent protease